MRRLLSQVRVLQLLKRQWPLYRPRAVITNLDAWLAARSAAIGWYGTQNDAAFIELYPGATRRVCGYAADVDKAHSQRRLWKVARAGILVLRGAYVHSDRGYVLSSANELINELSPGWSLDITKNPSFPGRAFSTFSSNVRHLSGVSAVLACDGTKSHYHFLLQLLPRIHLCGSMFGLIDRFLVPDHLSETQFDALVACGIEASKIHPIGRKEKVHVDYLIAPSIPSDRGAIASWAIQYLQDVFPGSRANDRGQRTAIYLTRGSAYGRAIANEAEIAASLSKLGFLIVDCSRLSLKAQAEVLSEANVIVSPHGAALANIVFARPDASVVELFHPRHVYPQYYQTLAEALGLGYVGVVLSEGPAFDAVADTDRLMRDLAPLARGVPAPRARCSRLPSMSAVSAPSKDLQ